MIKKFVLSIALSGLVVFPSMAAAQSAQSLQIQIYKLKREVKKLEETIEDKDRSGDFDLPIEVEWGPSPKISSADGNFEMKIRGKYYTDFAWYSDAEANLDLAASEMRTARMGIEGKAWKDFDYKFTVNFTGGVSRVVDAYIGKQNFAGTPLEVRVGHFKIGTSLETNTSSNYIDLMERGSIKEVTDFSRRMGVGLFLKGELSSLQFGVQRGSTTKLGDKEGWLIATRGHRTIEILGDFLHLGLTARWRKIGKGEDAFRYRARPFNHMAPQFIDTGAFSGEDKTLGLEAAYISEYISFQGEVQNLKATYDTPMVGLKNPTFKTGYASATWFVTGEDRNYSPEVGGFGRPTVNDPIHKGGAGAVQLTLRYDFADLNDEAISGGKQTMWIAGVNWFLNRHTRLMLNYSYAKVKDAFGITQSMVSAAGKNTISGFGFRAQLDF